MTTTTIRLDDRMKERVAAAAAHAGKTTHGFIIDAIASTVEQVEEDEEFHRVASERWQALLASGKTVPSADARKYLEARASGKRARKPIARKLVR